MLDFSKYKNFKACGHPLLQLINALDIGQEYRKGKLAQFGVTDIKDDGWYDMEPCLRAYHAIGKEAGDMNLYLIGKGIVKNLDFPPMDSLKDAFLSLDVVYHMNHQKEGKVMFDPKTGKKLTGIGHYNLVEFDEKNRKAVFKCDNPYPSKLDEGILTQLLARFKPKDSFSSNLELDGTKDCRVNGGESDVFIAQW